MILDEFRAAPTSRKVRICKQHWPAAIVKGGLTSSIDRWPSPIAYRLSVFLSLVLRVNRSPVPAAANASNGGHARYVLVNAAADFQRFSLELRTAGGNQTVDRAPFHRIVYPGGRCCVIARGGGDGVELFLQYVQVVYVPEQFGQFVQ